jgi:hypothetical protein
MTMEVTNDRHECLREKQYCEASRIRPAPSLTDPQRQSFFPRRPFQLILFALPLHRVRLNSSVQTSLNNNVSHSSSQTIRSIRFKQGISGNG